MSIAINSDVPVTLSNLKDSISGSYLNAATVTGYLLDMSDTVLTSFSMSYVSASNGQYRGTLSSTITSTLTDGQCYKVRFIAVSGGQQRELDELHIATTQV